MNITASRIIRFAVLAVGLLVAGCSTSTTPGIPLGTPPSTAVVVGADLPAMDRNAVEEMAIGQPGEATKPPGLTSREFTGNDSALGGPHFAMRLSWVAVGPAITDQRSGPTRYQAMRAADGQELVAFGADPEVRNGLWPVGDQSKPVAELLVDGKPTTLTRLPLKAGSTADGVVVIASVPSGADVRLRITDQERAQTLDVRTGKRGDDAIAGFYRKNTTTIDLNKEVPSGIAVQARNYPVTFQVTVRATPTPYARLAPYAPDRGWAAPGRSWLLIPNPSFSASAPAGAPIIVLDSVHPSVFGLRTADGTEINALEGKHTYQATVGSVAARGKDIAFDVPADFTTGTYRVKMSALTITAKYSNGPHSGRWSPAPPPIETAVSFT